MATKDNIHSLDTQYLIFGASVKNHCFMVLRKLSTEHRLTFTSNWTWPMILNHGHTNGVWLTHDDLNAYGMDKILVGVLPKGFSPLLISPVTDSLKGNLSRFVSKFNSFKVPAVAQSS